MSKKIKLKKKYITKLDVYHRFINKYWNIERICTVYLVQSKVLHKPDLFYSDLANNEVFNVWSKIRKTYKHKNKDFDKYWFGNYESNRLKCQQQKL